MFRRRDDSPDVPPAEPAGSHHRLRRSWPQRLVLGVNLLLVVTLLATAAGLYLANDRLSDRQVVTIQRSSSEDLATAPGSFPEGVMPEDTVLNGGLEFEEIDVAAQNWLVTGVDNGDCVAPGQAPAANIGDRSQMGERGDTIMLIRIDPPANQAAILSFPRDLWVNIAGTNRKSRINAAYDKKDPSRLIQTIEQNFFLPVDHYLSIDFCAFKRIVEAVGGVKVPFPYAVRDRQLGFTIPAPGCYELGPDAALDYVRSRYYQYQDPTTGQWKSDPTSDFGRISRQQDFIRRAFQKALDRGARDPRVAWSLLNTGIDYVVTDDDTTPQTMLQLAQAMRNLEPGAISMYTIESRSMRVGNNAVLDPRLSTDNMEQILTLFRGLARLAEAPEQLFSPDETTTTLPPPSTFAPTTTTTTPPPTTLADPFAPPPSSTTSTAASTTTTSTTTTSTTSTLPLVLPEQNTAGIVPPDDPSCR
jgi:LCP family protein required for cell wall assembly